MLVVRFVLLLFQLRLLLLLLLLLLREVVWLYAITDEDSNGFNIHLVLQSTGHMPNANNVKCCLSNVGPC